MSSDADHAKIIRLLEMEFEYLQRSNDKYDNSRFAIKNWAITTSGALLALSITASNPGIALVGVAAVAVFAYIEVLYIYIQDLVVQRCNLIETLLDSAARGRPPLGDGEYKFGISQAFQGKFTFAGLMAALRGRPHIYVLYVGLLVSLASAAILVVVIR